MLFLNHDALQRGTKAQSLHRQKPLSEISDKNIVLLNAPFDLTLFGDEDRLIFFLIKYILSAPGFLKSPGSFCIFVFFYD